MPPMVEYMLEAADHIQEGIKKCVAEQLRIFVESTQGEVNDDEYKNRCLV